MSTSKKKAKIQHQDAYFAQQRAPMKSDLDGIRDSPDEHKEEGQRQHEGDNSNLGHYENKSNQNDDQNHRSSSKLSKT